MFLIIQLWFNLHSTERIIHYNTIYHKIVLDLGLKVVQETLG